MLRPGDVVVATYPKCGTTLVEQIVLLLLSGGDSDSTHPLSRHHHSRTTPASAAIKFWPEDDVGVSISIADFENIPQSTRRILKTHAPIHLVVGLNHPTDSNTKPLTFDEPASNEPGGMTRDGIRVAVPEGVGVIYVTRNPKDAAVSMYHHALREFGFDGTLSDWIRMTLDGNVEFGSWFNHTRDWWTAVHGAPQEQRQHRQMLWLHYEDILNDMEGAVRTIADFLHVRNKGNTVLDDDVMVDGDEVVVMDDDAFESLVRTVVVESSFQRMRDRANEDYARLVRVHGRSKVPGSPAHFRQGRIGGWKDELSTEHSASIDMAFEEQVNAPLEGNLRFIWD